MEVGNASGNAPVPDVADPRRVASPVSGTDFAARDDPVQAVKVELIQGTEQGFGADEADGRRDLAEVARAPCVGVQLDRDTNPDVRRPGQRSTEPCDALGALGEDLTRAYVSTVLAWLNARSSPRSVHRGLAAKGRKGTWMCHVVACITAAVTVSEETEPE